MWHKYPHPYVSLPIQSNWWKPIKKLRKRQKHTNTKESRSRTKIVKRLTDFSHTAQLAQLDHIFTHARETTKLNQGFVRMLSWKQVTSVFVTFFNWLLCFVFVVHWYTAILTFRSFSSIFLKWESYLRPLASRM